MSRPFLPEGLAKDKRLNIRLSEKELQAVERFAKSKQMTISTLFRTALKEYAKALKNNEKTTRNVGSFPDTF
jgi:predicted DNA binding CopG/RHH family protein